MKALLGHPWFQLFALLAAVSFGIFAYNDVACHAYTGGSCTPPPPLAQVPQVSPPNPAASSVSSAPPLASPTAPSGRTTNPGSARPHASTSAPPSSPRPAAKQPIVAAAPPPVVNPAPTPAAPALAVATVAYKAAHTLNAIAFRTPNDGLAGGHDGVFRTTDGGRTWVAEPIGTNFVSGIAMLASGVTYVVSMGGTFRSAAAGAPWERVYDYGKWGSNAIAFSGLDVGVMVGACGQLQRTSDGGKTWQALTVAAPPMPASSFGCDGSKKAALKGVALTDGGVGLAVGERGGLLRTADGGRTWDAIAQPATRWLRGVANMGGDKWLAVGSDMGQYGRGVVLRSEDAGRTWTEASKCLANDLNAVAFRHGIGVLGGGAGKVCLSGDTGRSWRDIYQAASGMPVYAVAIPSPGEAIAVLADGSIVRLKLP